jgi:hypothetical protein
MMKRWRCLVRTADADTESTEMTIPNSIVVARRMMFSVEKIALTNVNY